MAASGTLVGRGYVSIRPEFEGDWSRSVSAQSSRAGAAGGSAFSKAFGGILSAGLKTVTRGFGVQLGAALAPAAGAAGVLATATLAAASAQTALKIGLSGVSDAVSEAFNPTSPEKFNEAMAKLSPNARSFVTELRSMKPAIDGLRLAVQDRLFEGLDKTMATAAKTTLPIFRNSLVNSAGALNLMGKNLANTATGLGKSGALGTALSYANEGLYNLSRAPSVLMQGLVQVGAAAGPSFAKLTAAGGSALDTLSERMTGAFSSGAMQDFIETGVTVLMDLGRIVGDAFAAVGNVLKAASDAGGQALSVVGELFKELRRITEMPEIQAALRTIFASIAQIAGAIAPVIGSVLQAVMPLIAAIAPVIAQLATTLGPVLSQLATQLGKALAPIIGALLPVLSLVGDAVVQIMQAVTPLLAPIGKLIGTILEALMPVLKPIIDVVLQLVDALVGPLNQIIQQFIPYIGLLGQVLGQVFGALQPLFKPLVAIVGQLAQVFADVYVQLIQTLMQVIVPLLPAITQLVGVIVTLAMQVISALMPSLKQLIGAGMQLLNAVLPLLPMFAELAAMLLGLATKVLAVILPPLISFAGWLISGLAGAVSSVIGWVASLITWLTKNLGPAFKWLNEKVVQPVWRAIQAAISFAWQNVIKPMFAGLKLGIQGVGAVFRWLRDKVVTPVWNGIRASISFVWEKGIRPAFDALRSAVRKVSDSFKTARDAIKLAWDKLRGIAKAPVSFIVNTVYSKGIVPTWNTVAKAFGAPTLDPIRFATGGVLPGYTPGRDVHLAALSGGEAVMRPEWTRAVGPGYVDTMNAAARTGGVSAIRRMVDGGLPAFADGGIFGWVKSAASKGWDLAKSGVSWLKDGIKSSAMAGLNKIVRPLIDKISGSASMYRSMVSGVPKRMLTAIFDFSDKADKRLEAAGIGGKGYKSALAWARTQNGKRYQWGGNGNPSWDCSGFVSAIESVIRGQKPHRRWATGAFSGSSAPGGWKRNARSPYMIGITNAGVGHTAGTLNGVNVESRGGDGVIVGRRARGYNSGLFTSRYGFVGSKYDAGGWLQPGMTTAVNLTGQPEAVLTAAQWRTMQAVAAGGSLDGMSVNVWVGNEEIRDITRAEVRDSQQRLISVLNAS
ncbi:hypothetical protein AB0H94_21175 [Streptomyces purpurascens]|uniref:hypothetical protein n=1 Tax=Streptomyces purpurascens TaxID=1924 RepID=UPI0034069D8F